MTIATSAAPSFDLLNQRLNPRTLFGAGTLSPWKVWKDSTTKDVKFTPLPRKQAVRLWHDARRFERQTRRFGRQDGALGRSGLAVLYALLFDFLRYASGQLDPSHRDIAKRANVSERSVRRGLVKLKAAGVLNWLRRCKEAIEDGRFTLRQETNAYAVRPISQWRGYQPRPEPMRPDPGTWGDMAPLPDAITLACAETTLAGQIRALESDASDPLALACARLGRRFLPGQSQ